MEKIITAISTGKTVRSLRRWCDSYGKGSALFQLFPTHQPLRVRQIRVDVVDRNLKKFGTRVAARAAGLLVRRNNAGVLGYPENRIGRPLEAKAGELRCGIGRLAQMSLPPCLRNPGANAPA